jgi:D-tyrosyl-tRNA(Tyr) deacylase
MMAGRQKQCRCAAMTGEMMISLLQRVSEAKVTVDGKVEGQIGRGLLVLLAVQPDDTAATVARMAERVLTYRVFPDAEDRMNRSLVDEGLALLVVPQFTLAADTKRGTRASFTRAAAPEKGRDYFGRFVSKCRETLPVVETGVFGADMKVSLVNDGPVTFWLEA